MKYGLDVSIKGEYANPEKLVQLAIEAEEAGWDGFFLQDFLIPDDPDESIVDPWTVLGAVAYATERMKIGILVTPLPTHKPWVLSRRITTLDHLSRGRLILGVGLGFSPADFTKVGMEADLKVRARISDEILEILPQFWTGKEVDYEGEYFKISGLQQSLIPYNGKSVPIWVGGRPNKKPMKRAAKFDGVYPMADTPRGYQKCMEMVAGHRELEGYEFAMYVESSENPSSTEETYPIYRDIGVTWLIEGSPKKFNHFMEFIKKGPRRVN
jgi:alkanesulfonate monooxygenase SsuD/methylene tetrahydromethanopterin reductase-like flavin-dependent oxidoreductase (luciferase family)